MNKIKYIAAALIAIAGLGLQQAKADTTTFSSTLNVSNLGSGFSGPFGTVEVSLTGQVATITFTASGNYTFIDGSAAAVFVNSNSFSVSNVTTGFTAQYPGLQQVDGWGRFNVTINTNSGSGAGVTTITFTVTNTSTTLWTSASDVLGNNGSGYDAAAHVSITNANGTFTGFAAESGGVVPDGGATVMLLGMALGALGMVGRYLKTS
ncbi:MAG TPA: hypothetical protein VKD89_09925 [Candidatus Udaeobacter sp.]|nr:hypothetical protein [Candidatus Udaeobacter sp.]